jgi:hypothetical protein
MIRAAICGLLLLAACGPQPPYLRDLKYTPNAALVNVEATISGMVAYSDPDNDISQTVLELYPPTGMPIISPRLPIENVGQGVVGNVTFNLKFTPMMPGVWKFNIFIIDLQDQESNRLEGIVKVN